MQLGKLILCILAFLTKTCYGKLSIEKSDVNEFLAEASIDILELCYTERFGTVGIAGPSAESIIKRILLRENVIPVTLIDQTSRLVPHHPVDLASRYKLQVFVVTVTDSNTLDETLAQVKNSTWWNHMASFLLIDMAGTKNGCLNAYEILWGAWKMNLLNANFMCLNKTKRRLIYTFNPYTSKAPSPWQQENTYKGEIGHVWTLFVQEYHKDESLCSRLDFDKTTDLSGYEIRAAAVDMESWWLVTRSRKPTANDRVLNVTAQLLMDSLNATWRLSSYPHPDFQPKNEKGFQIDPQQEVANGSSDIFLIVASTQANDNVYTYPFYQSQLGIVTQYRGEKSQLGKLVSVLDKKSRFGVVTVLILTFLFFKCWLRKPLTPAFLDLVLIICNAGLQRIPQRTAPRIYLASLFIVVVTIQGIYSGQLASLLTKKVRLPTVDSFEDLARSNHMIYGPDFWLSFFDLTTFKGRLVNRSSPYCDQIKYDVEAACAGPKVAYISKAARENLHLSRETLGGIHASYLIRKDLPLEDRINKVYERLAASGIPNLLYAREIRSEMNLLESYERQDQEPILKVLTLEHLGFAFVILAIGLGLATIVFIIEVTTFGKKNVRPRIRLRR